LEPFDSSFAGNLKLLFLLETPPLAVTVTVVTANIFLRMMTKSLADFFVASHCVATETDQNSTVSQEKSFADVSGLLVTPFCCKCACN
jgi:hypothetical protein